MEDLKELVQNQRRYFDTNKTKDVSFRLAQLKKLYDWVKRNADSIASALKSDLNKPPFEAYATETGIVLEEIRFAVKHLKRWAKPKRVRTPLTQFKSKSYILSEPYGVALIMSPWNYPFQLTVAPLVAAIAAGNCAVVKPSAYSPATTAIIAEMAEQLFSKNYVAVVQGGREENQGLLKEKFDYIFFTGGVSVGKTVMRAAAENLTPLSLELGGKSPCIVDKTADIPLTARRIVWGKFLNAGQTCVAPDYLLVDSGIKDALVEEIKAVVKTFYGENPLQNDDYPKIINKKHFYRILGLVEGEPLCGGKYDPDTLKIEPTVINSHWSSAAMSEEIFGPLLPVISFDDIGEAIAAVKSRPKPLALYLFTTDKETESRVLSQLSFGGGCINDTVVHLATVHMPFGGVGESGMGGYHGKFGFDTFSHKKSILKKSLKLDIKLRYPPYEGHLDLLKKIQK